MVTAGRGAGEAAVRATGAPLTRAPLTLLVNEWSASASEIFAGRCTTTAARCSWATGARAAAAPSTRPGESAVPGRVRLLSGGYKRELAAVLGSVLPAGDVRGHSTQAVQQGPRASRATPGGEPRADPAAPRARTYGKGLIQSVYELSDSSGLVLTVGKYLTPARTDIDREGIAPDFRHTPSAPAAAARLAACRAPGSA